MHPSSKTASLTGRDIPVVIMTKSEAEKLSAAIDRARIALVLQIAKVDRKRSLSDAKKLEAVTTLRADLEVLKVFHEAHNEAHGLGGY